MRCDPFRFLPDRAAEALGVRRRAPTAQRPTPNAECLQVGQMGRMGQILYRREVRRWGAPRPPSGEGSSVRPGGASEIGGYIEGAASCMPSPEPSPVAPAYRVV